MIEHKTLIKVKVTLYRALILPIETYESGTWVITTTKERKLLSFEMQCLRSILGSMKPYRT